MTRNVVRLGPNAKIVFDWEAFSQLRKQGQKLALEEAEDIAAEASNYPTPAPTRHYAAIKGPNIAAVVSPSSLHAKRSNAKHNTLVKMLRSRR